MKTEIIVNLTQAADSAAHACLVLHGIVNEKVQPPMSAYEEDKIRECLNEARAVARKIRDFVDSRLGVEC